VIAIVLFVLLGVTSALLVFRSPAQMPATAPWPSPSASAPIAPSPLPSPAVEVTELPPVVAPTPSHPTTKPPRPTGNVPTKPPVVNTCNPPYYYVDGVKKFKPNCL
jgi:hypothetical protein